MANRLSDETSPYLLQHANNPVNWYPWSDEALQRSKTEDRPIFLSIGYSACHWCHVMEHESFEDDKIAEILNEHFVCIKVDREERPDLDQIYMSAVQMLTGRGGWPMSVFLTPALEPFFGGTYWPPQERMGMPGFQQVLSAVIDAWDNRRDQAIQQAGQLAEKIREIGQLSKRSDTQPEELLRGAAAKLEQIFDFTHGGFGSAPKFPHSMNLQLLLRVWRRWPREGILQMVQLNLDKMFRGGIYDHLGGGFARYSVDDRWLVPHFEKMLYDNALLVDAYLDTYLVTGQQTFAQVVHETLAYILGYMTDELGGFHSAEDADSEGEEGKFYVWTADEITDILGAEAAEQFSYVYDVTETGNFEGKNILNLPKSIEQCATVKGWDASQLNQRLSQCRLQLLAVRDRRVRPGKDDKILASWNGLMIQSMARAAAVFQSERYLRAATGAANFIQERMTAKDGRLLHCWRDGQAKYNAYLDDYACLGNAYVSLYEAGLNESWIDHAVGMADTIMKRFRDRENDAFFYTSDDHERLIARNKDLQDGSVPSGNAMAATFLIRIGKLCGRADYLTAARETIASAAGLMEQSPTATGQMLIALDMDLGPLPEIVILGDKSADETQTVLSELHRRFIPNKVMACRLDSDCEDGSAELDPIFVGKQSLQPKPTVYVCEKFACQKPLRGKDEVLQLWSKLADGREDAPATVD